MPNRTISLPPARPSRAGLTLGGLLLFLTSRGARSLPAACTRGERWLLVLGAPAVAGYPVTFHPAVARTGVAAAVVIALASAPVFAGLLAWFTGRARPTSRWGAATGAACWAAPFWCWAPSSRERPRRRT
ncbi:hypothetical protein AB0G67_19360 [Streptomyces sp. NPDC021056]|uniref:hypothetical protein n=1 Tax=Streptomyces sp. NPDC021056 TaxID=3155012 RepID=UPI0033D41711